MKKIIALLLACVMIVGTFVACSKADDTQTEETTTLAENATDNAKIKMADAVNLIESYSNDELGLTEEERDECTFAVAGEGQKIDDEMYIQVIAAIKIAHENEDGETTYTFDTKGTYYINYDGTKVLREVKAEDGSESTYEELPMHEVESTTVATEETTEETTVNE